MKSKRVVRFIGMVAMALLILIPALPVLAQVERSMELEPDSGRIGDKVTVTGTGFNKSTASTDKYAALFFSSQEADTSDDIDTEVFIYETVKADVWLDEDGDFEVTFRVPEKLSDGKIKQDVTGGTYYVYACHYQSVAPVVLTPRIRAVATFTVIKGEISISPRRGPVGTPVEVTGTDFPQSTSLTFRYDDYVLPVDSGNKKTSSLGGFFSVIVVPDSTAGPHTIAAIASDAQVSTTFTVKPEIALSSTSGEANARITVKGTGFSGRTNIDIWFHSVQVAIAQTNALGSFSLSFKAPSLDAGLYTVSAEGLNNIAKAKFTILAPPAPVPAPAPPPSVPQAIVSISTREGYVGQGLVISGAAFKAGGLIAINYDGQTVTTTNADSNGLFAASFIIPASKYGEHTVTVSDGANTVDIGFTVESTPPPIPTLLFPEPGDKLQAPITFYWTGVTDESMPVAYDLQVATRKDFSKDSIIIEQEGLSQSEYTITSEDQQKLVETGKPYYWRVRAVDGASNEGNWTSQGMFYVSAAFPGWALYALIALGIVFLFALGYFSWKIDLFRRRTAG